MPCDFCRQNITEGVAVCPYCGHLQKTAGERSQWQRSKLLAVVASAAVLIAWHFFFPKP